MTGEINGNAMQQESRLNIAVPGCYICLYTSPLCAVTMVTSVVLDYHKVKGKGTAHLFKVDCKVVTVCAITTHSSIS